MTYRGVWVQRAALTDDPSIDDFPIPNNANAALPFNRIVRNWNDGCDLSNPLQIVIGPGIHLIAPRGQVVWKHNTSGLRQSVFWKNGWFVDMGGCTNMTGVQCTTSDHPCISGPIEVCEGDRIQFIQKQVRLDFNPETEEPPFLDVLGGTGTWWGFDILE
ncbi:MAG: hypothetical protein A3I66_21460 [Burkholderiales bacterium RIFCSPLOWO2_02_FULL_57_36]|nr:MAG: hypothetical protein A3I66_21460 [Burkholderiales bacterium RIFCSPLOWO2_02_FULL_57_36]